MELECLDDLSLYANLKEPFSISAQEQITRWVKTKGPKVKHGNTIKVWQHGLVTYESRKDDDVTLAKAQSPLHDKISGMTVENFISQLQNDAVSSLGNFPQLDLGHYSESGAALLEMIAEKTSNGPERSAYQVVETQNIFSGFSATAGPAYGLQSEKDPPIAFCQDHGQSDVTDDATALLEMMAASNANEPDVSTNLQDVETMEIFCGGTSPMGSSVQPGICQTTPCFDQLTDLSPNEQDRTSLIQTTTSSTTTLTNNTNASTVGLRDSYNSVDTNETVPGHFNPDEQLDISTSCVMGRRRRSRRSETTVDKDYLDRLGPEDRKRELNKLAAKRCRDKKFKQEEELKEKARMLRRENSRLKAEKERELEENRRLQSVQCPHQKL